MTYSGRLLFWAFLTILVMYTLRAGKAVRPLNPVRDEGDPPVTLGERYRPEECGELRGTVRWESPMPKTSPFPVFPIAYVPKSYQVRDNPLAPQIDPVNKGLAGALLCIRDVDPGRSKPWDLPPVQIGCRALQLEVTQGDRVGVIGIARLGDPISLVAHEADMHTIRGRGAMFFTHALTEPNKPLNKLMNRQGLIEISSASSYYWARSFVFVEKSPYCAVSARDGSFEITHIPPGEYELDLWIPNWQPSKKDRDPELLEYVRMQYGKPLSRSIPITIRTGDKQNIRIPVRIEEFLE